MTQRLQTAPLGRPPSFKEPATLPPFTAEATLKRAVERLASLEGLPKSEIMRRAMKLGMRQLLRERKGELDPMVRAAFDAGFDEARGLEEIEQSDEAARASAAFNSFVEGWRAV